MLKQFSTASLGKISFCCTDVRDYLILRMFAFLLQNVALSAT